MSELGGNIYLRILSTLAELGIPRSSSNIISWTADQLSELSCITCVNVKTLKRFQTAHRIYSKFGRVDSPLSRETAAAVNAIKREPNTFIPVFFALTGNDATLSVADLLTHSRDQFLTVLREAGRKYEIPAGLDSLTNAEALAGSRDAILLNPLDNADYYDAKLIHLAPISYTEKSTLLDNALDGGGLQSIIAQDLSVGTMATPTDKGGLRNRSTDSDAKDVASPKGSGTPIYKGSSEVLSTIIPIITLDAHLQHFPPLLQLAVNDDRIGPDPDYYTLTLRGVELWKDMDGPVPPRFSNIDDYAATVYTSISAGQPTARLSKNLRDSGLEDTEEIRAVLDAHRDFNIDEHSVSSFFTTERGQPNYIPNHLANRLQTLQRSVKLTGDTTDLNATRALLDTNLTSAHTITQKGERAFTEAMLSKGIAREVSATIYCRSVAMLSTVTMLATQYLCYEQESALMPASLVKPAYKEPGRALLNLPDMESLFGSFNTCACSHCQSVYSPAAYLTDLLHWLNGSVCNGNNGGKTGFDALMSMTRGSVAHDRRKDIKYLNLNCRNTNTLLPYIRYCK
jgi:hypothetical protein